jgi:hypothetical protein
VTTTRAPQRPSSVPVHPHIPARPLAARSSGASAFAQRASRAARAQLSPSPSGPPHAPPHHLLPAKAYQSLVWADLGGEEEGQERAGPAARLMDEEEAGRRPRGSHPRGSRRRRREGGGEGGRAGSALELGARAGEGRAGEGRGGAGVPGLAGADVAGRGPRLV